MLRKDCTVFGCLLYFVPRFCDCPKSHFVFLHEPVIVCVPSIGLDQFIYVLHINSLTAGGATLN